MDSLLRGCFWICVFLHCAQSHHLKQREIDDETDAACDASHLPMVAGNGFVAPMQVFYAENEEVEVVCGQDLITVGASKSVCNNGTFIPTTLVCGQEEEGECSGDLLPTISGPGNYESMKGSYKDGEKVKLICDENYIPGIRKHVICSGGKFYPTMNVKCIAAGCANADLPKIEGLGRVIPYRITYQENETVKLRCERGYQPEAGATYSTCINSKFDPPQFKCIESGCDKSTLPQVDGNGYIFPLKEYYKKNEAVKFACARGFVIDGDKKASCKGGTFKPDTFVCKPTSAGDQQATVCSKLPTIDGPGQFDSIQETYIDGERVNLICDEGNIPGKNGLSNAVCVNKKFRPTKFSCVEEKDPVCHSSPVIEGPGITVPNKVTYKENQVARLRCKYGYEAEGADKSTCINGQFEPNQLKCSENEVICSTLPMIGGPGSFQPLQDVYSEDDKIDLICDEGTLPGRGSYATCVDGVFYPYYLNCI